MHALRWVIVVIVCAGLPADAGQPLPRSTPEQQGVDSAALERFVRALDALETPNSLMVVRHGSVIAEGWWHPYRAEAPHSLYSLSKSFTSTAVGMAVAEGKLNLDDQVMRFFAADLPAEPSDNLRAMRLRDLLRMATGHQTEPPRTADLPWTKSFLAHPVPFKPGTHFLYNTSATYIQSAMVQQATGEDLLTYLTPRLFEPLGIEGPTWEMSPQGVATGGYGLSIRTEDIAKFGQLYLQNGQWNGVQLVPREWVAAATSLQTANGSNPASDWDQGYGYQFWRCRHGAYRGDGAFGQYCVVLPDVDAVVVITSGVRDMQAVLNLVWDHLLPAFHAVPLPANVAAADGLRAHLEKLVVPLPMQGERTDRSAWPTIGFPANDVGLESIRVESSPSDERLVLTAMVAGQTQQWVCGLGSWCDGRAGWGRMPDQPMAGSAAWQGNQLEVRLCFYETPFIVRMILDRDGDRITLRSSTNVGFGTTDRPPLVGEARP